MASKKVNWKRFNTNKRLRRFNKSETSLPNQPPKFKLFKLEQSANWLDSIVTIFLKLGTLFLLTIFIIFVVKIFKSEGYIIESFAVPEAFEKSGYDGFVIAQKIQDKVQNIKEFAKSVKADSVQLLGNDQPELDLKVMGVGVSLRTLVYQMRNLLGQKNEAIQGEITAIDDQFNLTLRMTGFRPIDHEVKVLDGNKKQAIDRLIAKAGETILSNTDPYRVAILCYKQKRYDEAIEIVRKIINQRPQEIHWAYLAWGSILEEQNQNFAASAKFKRATELKPDFSLAYDRLGWNLFNQKEREKGELALRKAVQYAPHNASRLISLAWLLHSSGKFDGADSTFLKASRLEPNEPGIWSSWTNSKLARGKPEEALEISQKAEQFAKEDAMGYLTKALGSLARGDSLLAFDQVMTALDFDPTNPIAIRAGIGALWQKRDYKRIIAIYQNADLKSINKFQKQQILNSVAMAYNLEGQTDNALNIINQAIEINPNIGYPYTTLAEIYALSGDMKSFYQYLKVAFEKGFSPDNFTYSFEPYLSLRDDPKFQNFIRQYSKKLKG